MIHAIPKDIVDLIYRVLHSSYYKLVLKQYTVLYEELISLSGNMTYENLTRYGDSYETKRRVMWRHLSYVDMYRNYVGIFRAIDINKHYERSKLPPNYILSNRKERSYRPA